MSRARLYAILGFIVVAMLSRFLPHPPNFTAISATALFSGYVFLNRWYASAVVMATMLITDLILGGHTQMLAVYLSLLLGVWMGGRQWRLSSSLGFCSLLFFVVVNFGVWLVDGMYPKTLAGLYFCYVAALPFLGNQLLGDFFYGLLLFGSLSIVEQFFPSCRPVDRLSIQA